MIKTIHFWENSIPRDGVNVTETGFFCFVLFFLNFWEVICFMEFLSTFTYKDLSLFMYSLVKSTALLFMQLCLYLKPLFKVCVLTFYESKGSWAYVEPNCNDNVKSLPEALAEKLKLEAKIISSTKAQNIHWGDLIGPKSFPCYLLPDSNPTM